MDDNAGIPEDLRCKRSDGKQWRCGALSMPDKTVCEKHYIQAKRRAATSAARAMERKARRKSLDDTDVYMDGRNNDAEVSRSVSPMNVGGGGSEALSKYKEKASKSQMLDPPESMSDRGFSSNLSLARSSAEVRRYVPQVDEHQFKRIYDTPLLSKEMKSLNGNALGEHAGKSSASDGLTCHYCGLRDGTKLTWCSSCEGRGYCHTCLSRWFADIPLEGIRRVCPACRGICTCRVCLQGDNLVKAKVQEIAAIDKLRYLHSLLKFVLPMLKQIYKEEIFEIGVDTSLYGLEIDVPRAKFESDEKIYCDFCKVTILDYHRHCTNCSYDLCLTCCRDLRRASKVPFQEPMPHESSEVKELPPEELEPSESTMDKCSMDFAHLFPKWRANSDGSIPCGPAEAGGCGYEKLILRRIFKISWVTKLMICAEEIINGCKLRNLGSSNKCFSCSRSMPSDLNESLYTPGLEEIKQEGICHFHMHWVKGEPIIVKRIFEHQLALSWEPFSIWRGIQETMDNKMDESIMVKAFDCLNDSEVEMELSQFMKGYSEGHMRDNGNHKILKLRKWPHPSALQEFLLCRRPEFLLNFPLIEFVHSKWGFLNLAARLPHDAVENVGPRLLISYGMQTDIHRSDPVTSLQYNMGDQVYLLVHRADVSQILKKHEPEKDKVDSYERTGVGAIWDVYRRQDVPKINEYLKMQQVKHPIYHKAIYLNKDHKRELKEQLGIEPWSFEQHVGESVFVPAGCPFQIMDLQSSVQLVFDFLSPESLNESARMAQEIRCLPDDHQMKIKMLEVSKVSLYAASAAIREMQQIVLDPKLSSEIKFENWNLTAIVAENLERVTKQSQLICS